MKQGDFVRSKSFLMTPAKPAMAQRQGSKLSLKEGLQRGISLSHQNLGTRLACLSKCFGIITTHSSPRLEFVLFNRLAMLSWSFLTQLLLRWNLYIRGPAHSKCAFQCLRVRCVDP